MTQQTKIWDLPLRVFHWMFAICIVGSIVTGKAENWTLHERFGLTILGLLVFRLIWGVLGSETARFAHFLKGPRSVIRNVKSILKRVSEPERGHSALGGWATLALLLIPAYLVSTGLFSTDGTLFDGPLAHLISFEGADMSADLHHYAEPFLFLVLLLHFSAMGVYYFWLRKNLIPPMITGGHQSDGYQPLTTRHQIFGLMLVVVSIAAAQCLTLLRPVLF